MIEAVKDKGYLKSLEKFGQKLDLYLEQNPNKDEVQEAPTKDEEGVAESEVPQDNSNNATKMFRKRALFSQTCNTMMQGNLLTGIDNKSVKRYRFSNTMAQNYFLNGNHIWPTLFVKTVVFFLLN